MRDFYQSEWKLAKKLFANIMSSSKKQSKEQILLISYDAFYEESVLRYKMCRFWSFEDS